MIALKVTIILMIRIIMYRNYEFKWLVQRYIDCTCITFRVYVESSLSGLVSMLDVLTMGAGRVQYWSKSS